MVVIVCNLDLSKEESRNLIKFLEATQQVNTQDKGRPVPTVLRPTASLQEDYYSCLMTCSSFSDAFRLTAYNNHLLILLAFKKKPFISHSKPRTLIFSI